MKNSLLLIVAAIGVIVLGFKFMAAGNKGFDPNPVKVDTLTRKYNGPKVAWPKQLENPKDYWDGGGTAPISFVKELPSGGKETQTCQVVGWSQPNQLPDGNHQSKVEHVNQVTADIDNCRSKWEWLNKRGEYKIRKAFVVDKTDGVDTEKGLSSKSIQENLNFGELETAMRVGDSVEAYGCIISGDRQSNCQRAEPGLSGLRTLGKWLSEPAIATKETSFYEGLANNLDWLAQNGGIPDMMVIGDGLEHSVDTADFYKLFDQKMLTLENFNTIWNQVFASNRKHFPDLSGRRITLVGNVRETGERRTRMERGLEFAAFALRKANAADVQIDYGK